MYACERCGKLSAPGEKLNRVVAEVRVRTYFAKDKFGNDVAIGQGHETVRELGVGRCCAGTGDCELPLRGEARVSRVGLGRRV